MGDENFAKGGANIHYLEKKLGMGGPTRKSLIIKVFIKLTGGIDYYRRLFNPPFFFLHRSNRSAQALISFLSKGLLLANSYNAINRVIISFLFVG